ncbi:prolyl oligopeptidase family serine peptidase [Dinghuibacter silviterrae]|nr:prolyl oligopeptidase family serine peptidase [Dinghuibacter silviterrae]
MTVSTPLPAQQYPVTAQHPVTDDYFGTKVTDPYRWLEDDNSEATKAWVEEQNKVTQEYLSAIPFRDKVRARLETLWNYPKYSSPFKKNEWYYFNKNDGLQNQAVLYRQKGLDATPEIFFDPNKLSADGTAALNNMSFSRNGKYAAYTIARSGSDWEEAYIKDVATGQDLGDTLRWLKFTGLSWLGDDGFYYSRYPTPDEQTKLSHQNQYHTVYFHKVGTPQSEDVLVYEDREHPLRTVGAFTTEDNRFLLLTVSEGTSGTELLAKDLSAKDTGFTLIVPGFDTQAGFVDNDGERLLVQTNADAPNYKVVSIDPHQPGKDHWITVIPERTEALQSVSTGGGYLYANYLKDASTKVYQHTYKGALVREIALPGIGTASGFGGEHQDKEFFYTYFSFSYPPAIFHYDVTTGKSTLFRKAEVQFNPDDFETDQVFFPSKDGTKVPMFLTYRKGMKRDGNNPVLLYGYGGFQIPMTPTFSISTLFFVEEGGIYAQVALRGGSEYGEAWHEAGMLHRKQNVFDDMIAAAEYLIKGKYTNKDRLALRGGSNGGLLVGACMTQRPDLFKVAIPQVGVMDMLRFQKFTIGWAWVTEYGSSDKPEDFAYLYGYSPYHNLKPGVSYPATLVTTADHDDRVVPAHSFKFAARLQADNAGPNPTLIRIDSKAGHGGGKPTAKVIDEAADIYSFIMYNLGMQYR